MSDKMLPKPKLLWVEWLDSSSRASWCSTASWKDEEGLIRSVGWLVYEDAKVLVLAPSYEAKDPFVHNNFLSAHSIPQGSIIAWGEIEGLWKE